MKYLATIVCLVSFLTFMACEGPTGPAGPPGVDGVDGAPGEIGFVMEWEDVDFTAGNDFTALLDFNDFAFQGDTSDISLVYFLWEIDTETGLEVWRPLPQTLIIPEGLLQYNYDFTLTDVKLFMDANFDLNVLGANDTDDWVVRVVVVPGTFVGGRKAASALSYEELAEELELPELKRRSTIPSMHRRE